MLDTKTYYYNLRQINGKNKVMLSVCLIVSLVQDQLKKGEKGGKTILLFMAKC